MLLERVQQQEVFKYRLVPNHYLLRNNLITCPEPKQVQSFFPESFIFELTKLIKNDFFFHLESTCNGTCTLYGTFILRNILCGFH
jgi:hypothetical protein